MSEQNLNINSKMSIRQRIDAKKITWVWPVLIVFARLVFAFIAQGLTALIFMVLNNPDPWSAAAPWWVVNGTLIDLGCIILLTILVRKEGIKLKDLINIQIDHKGKFILQCIGFVILFFILFMAGGMIFGKAVYGAETPPIPYGTLPLWAAVYSICVWPILWSIAEQLTYLGYSLPRIEAFTNKKFIAISIVCFGWCIQHIALPFSFDMQWTVYRFLTVIPIALILPIVYLKTRRLIPFIIAHWFVDFMGTFMFVFLPLFQNK